METVGTTKCNDSSKQIFIKTIDKILTENRVNNFGRIDFLQFQQTSSLLKRINPEYSPKINCNKVYFLEITQKYKKIIQVQFCIWWALEKRTKGNTKLSTLLLH